MKFAASILVLPRLPRIDVSTSAKNETLELCESGDCTAIADTGTSLIGVPKAGPLAIPSHQEQKNVILGYSGILGQNFLLCTLQPINPWPGVCAEDALASCTSRAPLVLRSVCLHFFHLSPIQTSKTMQSILICSSIARNHGSNEIDLTSSSYSQMMSASRTSFPGRQVDDDKVPSADSTDYFDCRNQPGLGSQRLSGQNLVKDVKVI